ncbi:MAG: CNNM domain-containing protein [Planctomycetota bacterium]
MIGHLVLLATFILLQGYFSGSETGAYRLNKIRLQYRAERKRRSALILQSLLADPQGLICTTLVGTNTCVYMSAMVLTGLLEAWKAPAAELISTLCLPPILLVFAEATPKNIFQLNADFLMYKLAAPLAFFRKIFSPAIWVLKRITRGFAASVIEEAGRRPFTAGRLDYFLDQGAREGVLTPYQRTMAKKVMGFGKIPAREVMIPLSRAVLAPKSATLKELRALVAQKRSSRIPVYEERPERIIGVVTALDFFCAEDDTPVVDMLRPPITVPENFGIDDVLRLLQHARFPMGIVVNQKDEAVGIITIKDLVEEIVGELEVW